MTKSEAIHHRALRCRPAKRNVYVTTHEALLGEYVRKQKEQAQAEADLVAYVFYRDGTVETVNAEQQRRSLWQMIRGWLNGR